MNKLFFYIPFLYSLKTRLKSSSSRIAWIFTYLIPVFIVFHYLYGSSFIIFILSILTIYTVYELGYVINDAELIKKEKDPTLRLSSKELNYYECNKRYIFLFRWAATLILSTVIFFINSELFYSVLLCCALIFMVYFLYNNLRNRFSIPLYSLLVFLRYFGIFLFIADITTLFCLWIIYPLCVTVEFCSKPKYQLNIVLLKKGYDFFRFCYYTFLILFLIAMYFLGFSFTNVIYSVLFYFWVYRSISYFILSSRYRNI